MLQKMTRTNEKGFTLIELMIVIAIIGILAAIAIPNFIAYRNKAFCSAAETDANTVAAALANHFAVPTNTGIGNFTIPNVGANGTPTVTSADSNVNITIVVTDASTRCPTDYQAGMVIGKSPTGYWNNAAGAGTYTKLIAP